VHLATGGKTLFLIDRSNIAKLRATGRVYGRQT
jgi:hypothetical protein